MLATRHYVERKREARIKNTRDDETLLFGEGERQSLVVIALHKVI